MDFYPFMLKYLFYVFAAMTGTAIYHFLMRTEMKHLLTYAAVLVAGFAGGTVFEPGQELIRQRIEQPPAAASPVVPAVQPIEERVINLPEDAHKWHIVALVNEPQYRTAQERELIGWFDTDPRLAVLKSQCKWHVYTPKNDHYRSSTWGTEFPPSRFPGVVIARDDGHHVFVETGTDIPKTAKELGNKIADCWPRPQPNPAPTPNPQPFIPDTPTIPDTTPPSDATPQSPSKNDTTSGIVAAIVGVIATLLIGGARDLREIVN